MKTCSEYVLLRTVCTYELHSSSGIHMYISYYRCNTTYGDNTRMYLVPGMQYRKES